MVPSSNSNSPLLRGACRAEGRRHQRLDWHQPIRMPSAEITWDFVRMAAGPAWWNELTLPPHDRSTRRCGDAQQPFPTRSEPDRRRRAWCRRTSMMVVMKDRLGARCSIVMTRPSELSGGRLSPEGSIKWLSARHGQSRKQCSPRTARAVGVEDPPRSRRATKSAHARLQRSSNPLPAAEIQLREAEKRPPPGRRAGCCLRHGPGWLDALRTRGPRSDARRCRLKRPDHGGLISTASVHRLAHPRQAGRLRAGPRPRRMVRLGLPEVEPPNLATG